TAPNQPIKPCADSPWKATLPLGVTSTTTCPAALLEGVQQPPFTLGLAAAMQTAGQALSTTCPTTLQIDAIDAPYPNAVPETKELDVVAGDHLAHVTIAVVTECVAGAPSDRKSVVEGKRVEPGRRDRADRKTHQETDQ